MEKHAKTTISLADTPVHRALSRARRSTLVILLLAGFLVGIAYKFYFSQP